MLMSIDRSCHGFSLSLSTFVLFFVQVILSRTNTHTRSALFLSLYTKIVVVAVVNFGYDDEWNDSSVCTKHIRVGIVVVVCSRCKAEHSRLDVSVGKFGDH